MKSGKLIAFAGSILMCLLTINTFAGFKSGAGATRIRFKRGESSATVNGKLTSRKLKQSFLVGARAGQELYVEVRAREGTELSSVNFIISDPFGKPVGTDEWKRVGSSVAGTAKIRLKQTGDYRIELTPPGMFYRATSYMELQFTLSVRIE